MDGIGKIILEEREQAGILQNELCKGVCSAATLSRLEWSEQNIGQWGIDVFLQRLGKSQDKFWTIVHIGDYELMELRRKLWNYILHKDYEKAEKEIKKYQKCAGKETMHEQFWKKCQGLIKGKRDNDWKGALQSFEEAIRATLPDFSIKKIRNTLMGRDEMQIVLLMVEAYKSIGEEQTARQMTKDLIENIKGKHWDEEELAKIYPKAVKVYNEFLKKENQYEQVIALSQEATEMLIENGIIFLLKELLQDVVWGMECCQKVEERRFTIREEMEYKQLKKQIQVLKEVWEEYGNLPEDSMLYCTNVQKDVSVSNEIMAKCRKLCNLSQEKASEDVCTVEQYSRIETGKCSPLEKSYRALMEKMNQAQERNRFFINAQEYSIHEKIRQIEKRINGLEMKKASEEWKKIREEIPTDTLNNQQYIARYDALVKRCGKEIDFEEYIQELEKALSLTIVDFKKIDIEKWPLSRNEIILLSNIASAYCSIGRNEDAKRIYYMLWNSIEGSAVDRIYHITEYKLISYNLGLFEGVEQNFSKAKEILKCGMQNCMLAGRFEMIASFLYCFGWVLREEQKLLELNEKDTKNSNDEKARYVLEQAFYLANILKLPHLCHEIGDYYQEEWNIGIKY